MSRVLAICSFLLLSISLRSQTFEVGGQSSAAPSQQKSKSSSQSQKGIGWGSSIEVGRNARAAEDALRRGNSSQAAVFADRAVKAAPQNAKLWFLKGYASRLAGHYQESLDAYQQGLKLEPRNPDGMSGMAQTYQRMGQLENAKRLLMQVINSNPKRQNDLMVAGELYLQTNDLKAGLDLLARAEALKPNSHAEVMMAVAYLKMKDPEHAKRLLDEAKRRDPRNPAIFRALANYYRDQHDYASAVRTLRSSPVQDTDVLADLGYSYELEGDKKNAAAAYSKAANRDPSNIGLQLSAAQAELRLGNNTATRNLLARAAAIDPEHYRLHALRAQLARAEDHPQEAVTEYQLAIARLPGGAVPEGQLYPIQLRLNLADIYRELGDAAAARQQIALAEEEVNRLQIEGPARAEFLRVRASIRSASNDFAGAEADLKEALKLDPENTNIQLQYANLLWHNKRDAEAHTIYASILSRDPNNRYAVEALGYLSREEGDNKAAERYFTRLAEISPDDYVPYLALGDLYTSTEDFARADASYQHAYELEPQSAMIIGNAANAAIQANRFELASNWIKRATGPLQDDPHILRERERVLFHQGKYAESARLGYRVLQVLPYDRNASVYLAYDLYNLGRYDDVLAVTSRYSALLPKEPNFPLLRGHVHKQSQLLHEAVDDYSEAIRRDPKMVEAYVNRGYVLNDLQNAEQAKQDFETALRLAPNNGVAHLGLAFSDLQLRQGHAALEQVAIAEKILGESGATHLARATAYRQERLMHQAESEYEVAIKYAPNDLKLRMALADTQYYGHRYQQAINTLTDALALSPDDPTIYAELAHAHAALHHREQALRYVAAAEKAAPDSSAVLLSTGEALLNLGDRNGAMQRFTRALAAPDANRVEARLLFARLFVEQGKFDDARQQVALAFAESRVGEASPVTADDFVAAANIFLAMNDFDLAQRYFKRAHDAGAADEIVAIGMANAELAQGNSDEAQQMLAQLGPPEAYRDNFDYTLAMANVYRQRHQDSLALNAFARANELGGNDDASERGMLSMAGDEGLAVTPRISLASSFDMHGLYDDETIYGLDRQIISNGGAGLPPPRSELETIWTTAYRAHLPGRWPLLSGFYQLRNARGPLSLPNEALIVNRDTWDSSFNSALNPVLRLGHSVVTFNTGLQFTVRRDSLSPVYLNQNLFRQFVYMSTNSLGNWLQINGSAFHESGPFTDQNLHSRELGASLQFVVGRPWGHTQLITQYDVRDVLYRPLIREFYSTSTAAGIQHEFGDKVKLAVLGEYIRSWRVQDLQYWIAQAMRPAAQVSWQVTKRWDVNGQFSFSRGQGFHQYDNTLSSLLISYVVPIRRSIADGSGELPVEYPLRLSFGIENQDFFNFTGQSQTILRPVIRLRLF
ncbi:MAG TPA: tetratricopeptide repeat protein [candidate division Zixibacteria bacterium]|nr:tetratricopeptide repeat protein [candidate division Zixibacteria bacterium]